jgi:hypothetical protein
VEGLMTITMCMLQMIMSPLFFNIMTHLIFHLVEELELCDPIDNNWHRVILNGQNIWDNFRVHAIISSLSRQQIWDSKEKDNVVWGSFGRIMYLTRFDGCNVGYGAPLCSNSTNVMAPCMMR